MESSTKVIDTGRSRLLTRMAVGGLAALIVGTVVIDYVPGVASPETVRALSDLCAVVGALAAAVLCRLTACDGHLEGALGLEVARPGIRS